MKKRLSRLTAFFLLVFLLCASFEFVSYAASDGYDHSALNNKTYWIPSVDGNQYQLYRLPGIVVSKQDTVIVYGEARRTTVNQDGSGSSSDECEMDLYLRRSTDGGETFGEHIWIAKGAEYYANGYGETIDNPVMIVGNDGRLHLLFCCNVGKMGHFYCYSDDDGISWTTPVNISGCFENFSYHMMAFGPGHGICLDDGTLVVSAWVYNGAYYVYSVYSQDNGQTWKIGQRVAENRDETCLVKLSNGGVLMNSRQHTFPSETSPYRRLSWSLTGISGWSSSKVCETLIDPACAGGMCSAQLADLPYAVLFVNNASRTQRNNLTVRCSFDDGLNWEKSLVIDETAGGYSDIAIDSKGKVYVIYEKAMGSRVHLASFSFYDAFCKKDTSVLSTVTSLEQLGELKTEHDGVTVETTSGGALGVTVARDGEPSLVLDVAGSTKAINVSSLPVMALRIKGDGANTSVKCGVYFRCGMYWNSNSKLYTSFSVPNDGKEHTVLVDLSNRAAYGGNLYSLELEFFSADKTALTGEHYEISSIAFFENRGAAELVYPPEPDSPEESTSSTTATETDAVPPDNRGGCSSSVAIGTVFPVLTATGLLALHKRKRKATQHQSFHYSTGKDAAE